MSKFSPQAWQSDVLDRSPWCKVFARWQRDFRQFADWPTLAWLNAQAAEAGVVNAQHQPIRFLVQDAPLKALPYELQIFQSGLVPTRPGNWHDLFNALCWLRFPATKAVLNARHADSGDEVSSRGRMRDALTLFDECGVIVEYTDDSWCHRLRQHDWQGVWLEEREQGQSALTYTLFGHSEFEKGLQPFRGWTAKALFLPCGTADTLDARLAAVLASDQLQHPRDLSPLPVLGVPGWHPEQDAGFYADSGYFRPKRIPSENLAPDSA
ncbi:DUF3025 domain-containing protein [Leeia oryzae]|uniref:DUF3025 domain-containing protein n=1 Tax=Leeia oryzae TaxID=356662 RepID=UPI000361B028|nr:DUF3025 domain-containing protein [Leeia oryzae]